MITRKSFLKTVALGSFFPLGDWPVLSHKEEENEKPVVISTWRYGLKANKVAWDILSGRGPALDAVEAGVRLAEGDPDARTIGYGGYPDRDGNVTLDACIMNQDDQCGSVAFLQHIMHPVSVARKVLEETPHVMLVGRGALEFALDMNFEKENLLTEQSRKDWEEWKKKSNYEPEINIENHDTIGMLALDDSGNLSGACTTSGAAYKMHGRVGDSPLIGSGLFVDNEVGAAAATGLGEEIIRVAGSHLVVENMRHGDDPETACRKAVDRIISKNDTLEGKQVAFIALNKQGEYGGYAIHQGFDYAVHTGSGNRLIDAASAN